MDYLSYEEDQLSEDSANRRKEQNLGKGSRKAVGLQWRSLNVRPRDLIGTRLTSMIGSS